MKTEKEKMLNGELYFAMDPELVEGRKQARQLVHEFNQVNDANEREKLIRKIFGTCGENIHVEPTIRVDYGQNIHVGEGFYANFDCILLDVCPIKIGNNAMLGPRVSLVTPEHPLDPIERNSGKEFARPITIGKNAWICSDATIVGGVTLGDNVVVGAGAVVTKSFGDNVVIGGNPARVIKQINSVD